MDFTYYVGEDIIINARLENRSWILCVTWQKIEGTESHVIDSTLPKYKKTKQTVDEPILFIKDCHVEDIGEYFLLAACLDDLEIKSEIVHINVLRGNVSVSGLHFMQLMTIKLLENLFFKTKGTIHFEILVMKYFSVAH